MKPHPTSPELIASNDPRLRRACLPVGRMTKRHAALSERLKTAMATHCGIGIAAPQIGEMVRVCIVLRDWNPGLVPIPMFDPTIIAWSEDEIVAEEGCLSFPDEIVKVRRSAKVVVRHLTVNRGIVETPFYGIEAACAQHEIDHLNGITFHMRGLTT